MPQSKIWAALALSALVTGCGKDAATSVVPQISLRAGEAQTSPLDQQITPVFSETFVEAFDVAVGSTGNVYVSDQNRVVKITPGGAISSIAIPYRILRGIGVDGNGDVYVGAQSDFPHHPGGLFEITPDGKVSNLSAHQFYFADDEGIAVDSSRNVFVSTDDAYGAAGPIYKRAPNGKITTVNATVGSNAYLLGIDVDRLGNLYVADPGDNAVDKISPHGHTATTGAGFNLPSDVAVDGSGDIFVADTLNNAVKEIAPNGTIVSIGSNLQRPIAVAVDASGTVYVVELGTYSARNVVEKMAPDGTLVPIGYSSPAGIAANTKYVFVADPDNNAVYRVGAGGALAAVGSGLNAPEGVAIDTYGNAYVANTGGGSVRRIATNGATRTVASGFTAPYDIALHGGSVYVSDPPSNVVKRISRSGNAISVGAGFKKPHGVAVDGLGNLYVADTGNDAIEKVTPSGRISTVGSGFSAPLGVAVDAQGNVYVADTGHGAVKKVSTNGEVVRVASVFDVRSVAVDSAGHLYFANFAAVYKVL